MPVKIPTYRDTNGLRQPDINRQISQTVASGGVQAAILARNQYFGRRMPPKLLPGLNTVGYTDADATQKCGSGWHYNEGLELTVVANGQLPFDTEQRKYLLNSGMAAVTAPWLHHRVGDPQIGPCRSCWFMLDVRVRRPNQPWKWPNWICLAQADRTELQAHIESSQHYVWPADSMLRNCFVRLAEAVRTDEEGSNASWIACLVNESLLLLLAALRADRQPRAEQAQDGKETVGMFWKRLRMNADELAQPWTLRKMAKRCGMGQTRFVYYTRQLANLTPLHCLNDYRLEQAERLLKQQPERSVTSIGMACGFSSGQWFSQKFTHRFGCAPQVYRTLQGGS
jgi:AraC family L-rhamnose operon regulatory protein RhaS